MDLGLGGVGMRRREFISLLGGSVAAWSGAARAQQGTRARRVGVLMALAESDSDAQPRVTAFLRQLQELGWTDGGNVRIDYRWTAGDVERARAAAKDLVGLEPDVILGHTTSSVVALRQETRTIPIVFTIVSEPVANRFVESLAHPGGNLTGFTNLEPAVAYGTNVVDQFRQAAVYVDQILRGTKPGDLPVQQPNKFQLVINLKTAKALGLTIPPTLLATADEVIE
jgi:putative tryptophan/tyrosine transport system substrate-binding protein